MLKTGLPGRAASVVVADERGVETALDLRAAGVVITALVDAREGSESAAIASLRDGGTTILHASTVLAARGFAVDDTTRQRVEACVDMATLQRWIQRAIQAPSLAEVFAPAP